MPVRWASSYVASHQEVYSYIMSYHLISCHAMLYTVMFTSSYITLYRVISTTMNQLIDVRCFKPHGTLMARNTSYKY